MSVNMKLLLLLLCVGGGGRVLAAAFNYYVWTYVISISVNVIFRLQQVLYISYRV